ncbi:TPA: HlyD family efflux transporter periplasmic adaptor subunit [Escherichia coli]|uniref:HlyD family secretion protein n=1 Tax=Escherichia coli TaxID=562 RepID=UPI0011034A32|nr:HlyD family efflux transporter periplasmic adaptor subunit [Escherichia coli]EFI4547662.1 HlyD family efflux transporter periplasmic adaptor subunit [Escherichia coli]EFJ3482412.1 HlyD family efflux transporter periplasmic adaptor subunit [Escherichia coli]EFL0094816.1 HlyD family efflux transporter periplasmic adaptor subunit [Escherichia coli]EFM4728198.1 HlyD family efflux transporter periplasmic adaptor subunit [Escherichia coli]EFM4748007.1 HlyD family efflux transporter periplasmic ad
MAWDLYLIKIIYYLDDVAIMEIYRNIKKNFLGDVFIPDNIKIKRAVCVYAMIVLLLAVLFVFAKYTQRKRVTGVIFPEQGTFAIRSDRNGVVENLAVMEGGKVKKGDVLFNISSSNSNGKFENSEYIYSLLLKERIASISKENKNEVNNYKKQLSSIDLQIRKEEDSIKKAKNDKNMIERAIEINSSAYRKINEAYKNKVVTIVDKNNAESQLLEKLLQRTSVEREIDETTRKVMELKLQKSDIESKILSTNNNYNENKINYLIQYYNNAEKYEYIQKSPVQGVVTSITKKNGAQAKDGEYIMSIIPDNAVYQAIMFISPDVIGRVKLNSKVTLHIDSYPYQRFGVIYGAIRSISDTPLSPDSVYYNYNIKTDVPSYVAIAEIDRNYRDLKLISNMTFKADVPLETRPLIKWLYSSLFENDTGITFK